MVNCTTLTGNSISSSRKWRGWIVIIKFYSLESTFNIRWRWQSVQNYWILAFMSFMGEPPDLFKSKMQTSAVKWCHEGDKFFPSQFFFTVKTLLESSQDNLRDETFHSPLTQQLFSFCRVLFTDVGSPRENTPTLVICFFIPYLVIKAPPATYTQIRRHCHRRLTLANVMNVVGSSLMFEVATMCHQRCWPFPPILLIKSIFFISSCV